MDVLSIKLRMSEKELAVLQMELMKIDQTIGKYQNEIKQLEGALSELDQQDLKARDAFVRITSLKIKKLRTRRDKVEIEVSLAENRAKENIVSNLEVKKVI